MMRTWTHRGCVALLTLAVAVPALRAAPPSDNPTIDDKLTEIALQQQRIQHKLDVIQANQDEQLEVDARGHRPPQGRPAPTQ